jgi:SAM-dependent methyltransferase
MSTSLNDRSVFVPESLVGFWFLVTRTRETKVIRVALDDVEPLIPERQSSYPIVLDVGCGQGQSFPFLYERFAPTRIIGIDYEEKCLRRARDLVARIHLPIEIDVRHGDIASLELPDASVDLVFCHQTFHHLTRQAQALAEFYRVLRPGGLLIFAESTRAYIHSWIIRLLFRHPMDMQRSAEEYQDMIRRQGFVFGPQNVSCPYLWWSRSDLGAFEWLGFPIPKPGAREETLINLAALKPK